jgi:hypothetical protein
MSFKKRGAIKRLVGAKEISIFTLILDHYLNVFEEHNLVGLEGEEEEKTDRQKEIIDFAANSANEMIQSLGCEPLITKSKNVHLLKRGASKEDYVEGQYEGGAFDQYTMACYIMKTHSEVKLAVRVFHELIHFKSYHAVRFIGIVGQEARVAEYRLGFGAENRKKEKAKYFLNIDEAIVTELAKRFFRKFLSKCPLLEAEAERINRKIEEEKMLGTSSIRINNVFFPIDDVYYFQMVGENPDIELFGYGKERKVLNRIIDIIFQENRNRFSDREEVFNIFAKVLFSGNMMPVARLVERTFGKGAFRALGEGLDIT